MLNRNNENGWIIMMSVWRNTRRIPAVLLLFVKTPMVLLTNHFCNSKMFFLDFSCSFWATLVVHSQNSESAMRTKLNNSTTKNLDWAAQCSSQCRPCVEQPIQPPSQNTNMSLFFVAYTELGLVVWKVLWNQYSVIILFFFRDRKEGFGFSSNLFGSALVWSCQVGQTGLLLLLTQ